MYYTIYKITNKIDGKFYIGSHKTKNLDDKYMGSGKYLKFAQEKYGLEYFEKEILHVFDTPEEMYAKEAEIVNEEFIATENTYNIKIGGFGGWDYINRNEIMHNGMTRNEFNKMFSPFRNFSEEKRKEIQSKATQKIIENELWKPGIKEIKRKYPNGTFYGKNHSNETKQKMSQSAIGKQDGEKNSQYGTMWITNGIENKKIKKDDIIPEGWSRGRIIKMLSKSNI